MITEPDIEAHPVGQAEGSGEVAADIPFGGWADRIAVDGDLVHGGIPRVRARGPGHGR